MKELDQARSLQQQSSALEQTTQRALTAGESDRVALNGARLQVAIAAGATLDTLSRVQPAREEESAMFSVKRVYEPARTVTDLLISLPCGRLQRRQLRGQWLNVSG